MVRIQIKGGVWKNSEDEILKVAVMKYGKNQWSRISSLLVRKSAKQCKARWFEWLDPSIKKTEWTREEEEKLLHLAKIMPTQWRTIAPIVGRTAAQCLEHYEKLLDAAQERDGEYDPAEDPRRLRPGEIDPNPEARPARPDARDMDEDEKEMLSEARARLANTKGKKAKRKAREKQLEEARRLASLQKRRELRAAGIEIRKFKRKKRFGIDYNEEIPFEKRPTPGFFDVSKDRNRTVDMKNDPEAYNNVDLRELEGKRRDEEEERERRKDAKRQKLHRKTDLPAHILQINKMNDPEFIQRRGSLAMPSPQITDSELHEIAKLGGVVAAPPVGGSGATKTLLASYGGSTPMPTPMRTPRTPMGRDTLLEEAQNLIALTNQQTPLAGGEALELHPTDFGGITPRQRALATPNTLNGGSTPSRTPSRTPKRGSTPMSTPARDAMSINDGGMTADEALMAGSRRSQKRKKDAFASKLASGLKALPQATNEYMLVKPELPPEVADEVQGSTEYEEDAEDAILRIAQQAQAMEQAVLRKRHAVIQRSLPRPAALNVDMGKEAGAEAGDMGAVAALLQAEMVAMIRYDAHQHPLQPEVGQKKKKKKKKEDARMPQLYHVEEEEMRDARSLIAEELCTLDHPLKAAQAAGADSDSDEEMEEPGVSAQFLERAWNEAHTDYLFLPSKKTFGVLGDVDEKQQLAAMRQEFNLSREHILKEVKAAAKLELKVGLLTGGYRNRAAALIKAMEGSADHLDKCQQERGCFDMLNGLELQAGPQRVAILSKEVAIVEKKEVDLQTKYRNLVKARDHLKNLLASSQTAAAK